MRRATLTLIAVASLFIAAPAFADADLRVTYSADRVRLEPGALFTYTIAVTNNGPQDASDVVLIDNLSPSVSFVSFQQLPGGPPGTLDTAPRNTPIPCILPRCDTYVEAHVPIVPVGATATFRLAVRVMASIVAADIWSRATVESATHDPSIIDNIADVVVYAGPDADLAISETAGAENSRGEIPIVVEVSNNGPQTVGAVTVTNRILPARDHWPFFLDADFGAVVPSQGTCGAPVLLLPPQALVPPSWTVDCKLGVLAPGGKATITVTTVRAGGAGRFAHSASVAPDENDPRPENNQSRIEIEARPRKHAARH